MVIRRVDSVAHLVKRFFVVDEVIGVGYFRRHEITSVAKTYVEGLDIVPNTKYRSDCPVCAKKNTFSVVDNGLQRCGSAFMRTATCPVVPVLPSLVRQRQLCSNGRRLWHRLPVLVTLTRYLTRS